MFKKIVSLFLLVLFFFFSFLWNIYANNGNYKNDWLFTIENYREYLKNNKLLDIEKQFNNLSDNERDNFINALNNWNFVIEKNIVSKNNIRFRTPSYEPSWRYIERIDRDFKILWIVISRVKIVFDFNYIWKKITRINNWNLMYIDYDYNPVARLNLDYYSEISKVPPMNKNWKLLFQWDWDWLRMPTRISYEYWLWKIWIVQSWTENWEFWTDISWRKQILWLDIYNYWD